MELTELQEKVFQEAKKRLQDKEWFQGVCMDCFPSDKEIQENFEDAVQAVVCETSYWDETGYWEMKALNEV